MAAYSKRHIDSGSDVRVEIMNAIADDAEVPQRTLLRLMLMVLDNIGGKIDVILQDEASLRHAVLNGHSETHESHHDWVGVQMQKEIDDRLSKRKIGEGLTEKILFSAIVFVGGVMVARLFG